MKTQFILAAALLSSAPAATIYSNLQDIGVPTNYAGVFLDVDTGTTAATAMTGWDINPFFGGVGVANSAAFQPVRTATGNLDAVLNLAQGTMISGSLTYSSGIGGSGDDNEHIGAGVTQFQVGREGYLGFKFMKNDGSGPYFGWMRVVFTSNTGGSLIRDWGYDDAGGSINIGRIQQSAANAGAQTVTLSPGAGESFNLGSVISNTNGNINRLVKLGAGNTTLTVANTYTGTTDVQGGTLLLSGTGALPSTTALSLLNAGSSFDLAAMAAAGHSLGSLSGDVGTNIFLGSKSLTVGGNDTSTVFSGSLIGTGGRLIKEGTGTLTLSGDNTYTGGTNITGGTLLLGNNNVLPNTAPMTLSGGTKLATAGYSDATGQLTVAGNAVIDLGAGASTLTFASAASAWTGILSIWNYSGGIWNANSTDKLNFLASNGANLTTVQFYSDNGTTPIGTGSSFYSGSSGQLVPVPEPGAVLAALLMLGLASHRERRRR